jgi:CHAT domain-containing protein
MPDTPGCEPLASAAEESDAVERMLDDTLTLSGPAATYDAVAEAMLRCSIAHFICHGISDREGAERGKLLLHDHESHPLTVAPISQLHIQHPDLAFLSACETTGTTPRYADEALHITAAFQTAGYRSVIGSLWKVQGVIGTRIAQSVYSELTAHGTRQPVPSRSAHALRRAILDLRATHPQAPGLWAAHVHFGR